MSIARAGSRSEALRLLAANDIPALELDYETGWRDALELSRLGEKSGIRVQYRGHESIAVRSPQALIDGLSRPKTTFRQRNLYCLFDLGVLADDRLRELEARAGRLGDYILAGHLLRNADGIWS